ncbi:MAG TPA: rhamnulose-1-phosphate aldolase [Dehalococcoidales bacterium]
MQDKVINDNCRKVMTEIAETAGYLWEKGWAERNGGNISVDVSDICTGERKRPLSKVPLAISQFELGGRSFLVKVAGARMLDVSRNPDQNILLITINDDLRGYDILWRGKDDASRPTSEFISHLKIHQYLRRNNLTQKVFLHTHPTYLIALSHLKEYRNEDQLNRLLFSMHPEVKVYIPEGVGFALYRCPSSEELADATVAALLKHRVIVWEKHGCAAIGQNPVEAFDLIDIVNKAAQIFFICKSAGFEPEGLSSDQLAEIENAFKGSTHHIQDS